MHSIQHCIQRNLHSVLQRARQQQEDHVSTSTKTLNGKTILMSGGSRGIGLAIALRAARDGANIAILSLIHI